VPADGTFPFTALDGASGEEDEATLTRDDGEITGWLNRCQHFRHVRLDKGSGAPERNGELVRANHGALFEADTGRCTHGPCEGRPCTRSRSKSGTARRTSSTTPTSSPARAGSRPTRRT